MRLSLKSFAKINLFLRVINKRDDGYHNIETQFQKISLFDRLYFYFKKDKGLSIKIEVEPKKVIIPEENNIIRKAILLFNDIIPLEGRLFVRLKKNIPIGAGLGGGSSNAATTLIALNILKNFPFPLEKLIEIGRNLGADVPFFLSNMNSCFARGIGDLLYPSPPINNKILLLYPGFQISTKEIYQNLDLTKRKNESIINDVHHINDLEEVAFKRYPILKELKGLLGWTGADKVMMTGSGSTLFAIFSSSANLRKAIYKLHKALKDYRLTKAKIIACRTLL